MNQKNFPSKKKNKKKWDFRRTLDRIRKIDEICRERKKEKSKPDHYYLCNDLPDDLKKIFSEGNNFVIQNGEYHFNMPGSIRCGFLYNSDDAVVSYPPGEYVYYKKLVHMTIPEGENNFFLNKF